MATLDTVPGKVSGQPIVRGTRIMPDPIVNKFRSWRHGRGNSRGLSHAFNCPDRVPDRVRPHAAPASLVKVLLDENLDHRLRTNLGTHDVFTASYKGWDGLKNHLPKIVAAIDSAFPGSFQAVDCGKVSRKGASDD